LGEFVKEAMQPLGYDVTDELGMRKVVAKWGLLRGVDRPMSIAPR
jgi:hypothetical protein